jgi:hypothetical protein
VNRKFSFNYLGILAGILMVAAMFQPWWSFSLEFAGQTDLYPYKIQGPGSEIVGYKRSPQMNLLTNALYGCIGMCFAGSLLRGKLGSLLMFLSGLVVFLASWRLLMRIEGVADRFHVPIQGHAFASYEGFARMEVYTWIQPGLYLIIAGGILVVLAGLLNSRTRINIV